MLEVTQVTMIIGVKVELKNGVILMFYRILNEWKRHMEAKMIGEERMTGKIDQVDGLIYFQDPKDASAAMVQFDDQILDVCNQVNALIDLMDKKGILPEDA